MKKLFIIGTGRNGSKLMGLIIGTSVLDKNRFGEIHHGLKPVFFKDVYMGRISKDKVVNKFKQSRDKAMQGVGDIYIEKNHLIVPILDCVKKAYPDALFLYVPRNTKDIVRSFSSRDVYTGRKNIYEDGRLVPRLDTEHGKMWNTYSKFKKACWYVLTMTKMCDDFLAKLDSSEYNIVSYEDMVYSPGCLESMFNWAGIDFNIDAIKLVLGAQHGSSCRTSAELGFNVDRSKLKNTIHWRDWSDSKKEEYKKIFGGW